MSALILGDSFVKRLANFENDQSARRIPAQMMGFSGKDVAYIRSYIRRHYIQKSVVILIIGSNDLTRSSTTPEFLTDDFVRLANELSTQHAVRHVIIFEILHRTRYNPRHFGVSLEDYNTRVTETNVLLKSYCQGQRHIHFWRYDRRVRRNICADGVHINSYGLPFFYRSVSRAVGFGLRQLNLNF